MPAERVLLGRVRAPSAVVLVIDFGRMADWSPRPAALERAKAGSGDVELDGGWAVAIGAVPTTEALAVWATRMGRAPFADCWRYVDLEVRPGAAVATSEALGQVSVERARLMFADLGALEGWREGESFDGKADACFEPLMQELQSSASGAGVIDIGDATFCGFSTSWGDGHFPLLAERDAAGELVRIRIHLGTDEAVAALRRVNSLDDEDGADDDEDDAYGDEDDLEGDDEDQEDDDENDDFDGDDGDDDES
jgi:hypothetical protein